MLTGAPYFDTQHAEVSVDELWNYIDGKMAKSWMVTTCSLMGNGSHDESNHDGLPYSHAYTILKTVQLSDGTKLVRIRNPWGSETYHGDWSDDSDKWTEQFKQEAGYVKADDGMWFMNASNYHESFYFTSANPDVQGQKLAYKAFFDLGTSHSEQITIQSPVDQKVYISAYNYNSQHFDNGNCNDNNWESSYWITHDRDNSWKSFKYQAYHADTINMTAGESFNMKTEVSWSAEDLVPHDFSIVVWSTVEPVTLTVGDNHSSQSFPDY